MTRVRWSDTAVADLQSIRDYLREHHPSLAHATVHRLHEAARSLKHFPNRGRIGRAEGTRELVISPLPYIIVYYAGTDFVKVLRIVHGAEDWRQ